MRRQLVEFEPDLRPDLAEGYEQWRDLFRDGLQLMRDRGDLVPAADPEVLANALLAALQGGLLLAQTLRRAEPLRDSLRTAVATWRPSRQGLRVFDPHPSARREPS